MDRPTVPDRTTIRLSHDLHRKLKVLAAERGTTMQALLEAALTATVEGGLRQPARFPQNGILQIPGHLEPVVKAFVEFWQHPKSPTDRQLRKLIETALGLPPEKEEVSGKDT